MCISGVTKKGDDFMILRHVTLKRRLSGIYECGALYPAAELGMRMGSADKEYVSFELNPTTEALIKVFPILKSNPFGIVKQGDQFELLFDGNKMMDDGFTIDLLSQHKIQIREYIGQNGFTEEDYESIGEFVFVRSRVSLKYLTEESRERLEDYLD